VVYDVVEANKGVPGEVYQLAPYQLIVLPLGGTALKVTGPDPHTDPLATVGVVGKAFNVTVNAVRVALSQPVVVLTLAA
jgi:hypothetical protein